MLAIKRQPAPGTKLAVNLMPCRIDYDGPIDANLRYWRPELDSARGEHTAYFRGRKLAGRAIKVPSGYLGSLLRVTDKVWSTQGQRSCEHAENDKDEEEDIVMQTTLAEELAVFDEVMVWHHDDTAPAIEDPYVRGVEEWTRFAKSMHEESSATGAHHPDQRLPITLNEGV